MLRKILREIGIFLLFVVLSAAILWPLPVRLATTVSDLGDPLLNAWILNWDHYAWTHGHGVYQAPIFYPAKYPLAFSENLFGIAAVMLPFYLAGLPPLVVYNLAFWLGFAFCGYGASVLARVVSRSMTAGLICGALFAFIQYRYDHLPHLQITWSGWLPIVLAALLVYWRDPRPRNAALFAGALLMNGLTNIHWLLFGTTAAAMAALVLLFIAGRRPLRFWIVLGLAAAVALALLVPVLMPYKEVSELYGMKRGADEVLDGSADWTDWLFANGANRTWGSLPDWSKAHPERLLFPGMLSLVLTGIAIVMARRRDVEPSIEVDATPLHPPRWLLRTLDVLIVIALLLAYVGATSARYEFKLGATRILSLNSSDVPMMVALLLMLIRFTFVLPHAWSGGRSLREVAAASRFTPEFWICTLWIVIGVLGSFGLKAFFHTALYHRVHAFQSLRVPARWAMIAYTGLIGTSAVGVAALLRERTGRSATSRAVITVLLAVATFFDVRPRLVWEHDVEQLEPVYRWLVQTKAAGPILELPMEPLMIRYIYVGRNAVHHVTSMNGVSGFEPPLHAQIKDISQKPVISDELMPILQKNGCRFLIIHEEWMANSAAPTHAWLKRELARGTLGFLRRFDHGIAGDWLFAVTKSVPDWPAMRETERDFAGRTPQEELAAMLDGKATGSEGTIAHVDAPVYFGEVHMPMTIAGWAMSPSGIKAVDILFESGRIRVPAELVPRGDVNALFPWYANMPRPGFQKTFPKLPRGVRNDTDIEIEVTDGRGQTMKLPDVMVRIKQ